MHRTRTLAIAWALTLLAQCIPALARSGDIADVLSQPRRLPPPTWVREGLRLTYYTRDYTGSGAGCRSVPDDSRLQPAAGKHGYVQADVVSLHRDAVLLDTRSWYYQGHRSALVLTDRTGQVGLPACGANLWVHPDALRNIPDKPKPPWKITKTPCKIGQTTYQAVRFDYRTAATNRVWFFDADSGILLAAVTGRAARTTWFTLVGRRQLHLPWTTYRQTPDWLTRGKSLRYEGKQTLYTNCRDRHDPKPSSWPVEVRLGVTRRYTRAVACSSAVSLTGGTDMRTRRRTLISGIAQIHPLCLPPDALRRLKAGQLIDTDNITKVKTTVASVGRDAKGRGIVTIRMAVGPCEIDCSYDLDTGLMVAGEHVAPVSQWIRSQTTFSLADIAWLTPPRAATAGSMLQSTEESPSQSP